MDPFYVIAAVLTIWLIVLTYLVYKINSQHRKLADWSKKESLTEIIETIIDRYDTLEKQQIEIKTQLNQLNQISQFHLAKVGLVRFNPFERVGGEQSFIVALVDSKDNGIVMTFLYTREGVRVYTKKLKEGRCIDMELSSEEKEAIKKAS